MKRRLIIMIPVAFVLILVPVLNTFAQPPRRKGCEERGAWRESLRKELYQRLNLAPEQQRLLENHRSEHRQKLREVFNNIRVIRKELWEELQKENLNLENIKAKQKELKNLFSTVLDLRLEGILKVNEILTPEQRKIMSEFIRERRCFQPLGYGERMEVPPPYWDYMKGEDILFLPLHTISNM